jgi:taurine dioxygenase
LPEAVQARLDDALSCHAGPDRRAVQPLVLRHPLTGRRGLCLDADHMRGILGMERGAAEALIALLLRHLADPRFEYRHRWRAGDVVLWDNRTVLHKANRDVPPGERRFLYRVMLRGTKQQ